MIFDIVMPKMGESLTEGTVLEWKKKIGETIQKDEIILEIATDKVDSEIPSPVGGTLVEIIGEVNKTYDVDTVIARVETSDDVSASTDNPEADTNKSEAARKPSLPKPATQTSVSIPTGQQSAASFDSDRHYSPLVKAIAIQEGISPEDLSRIPGTGFRGRVSKKDVLFYLETRGKAKPAPSATGLEPTGLAEKLDPESFELIEMDSMRKSIAKHMRHSLDTSAHVYVISDADLTSIMNYIKEHNPAFKKEHGHSLTVTHFIALAVRNALQEFPLLNASLDGSNILQHKHLNIGIAIAVGNGLVVPPVRNAEEKSLQEISDEIAGIVAKARDKKLTLDDLEGATFSITNFGVFGNLAGFPIINQPNVGILGVGAIQKRPVVLDDDQIAVRQMCTFTLGFDHRLIDGAMGGQFLEAVTDNLEQMEPALLL